MANKNPKPSNPKSVDPDALAKLYALLDAPHSHPAREVAEKHTARAFAVAPGAGPAFFAGPPAAKAGADLPALTLADLDQLDQLLNTDRTIAVQRARRAFDSNITEAELRRRLSEARMALTHPEHAAAALSAHRAFAATAQQLPPEFEFDGMDLQSIPIDPGNTKYEEFADLLGWIINSGRWALGPPEGNRSLFPWHDGAPSGFVYPLVPQHGQDMSVALFADFGTGLYHSRYIAKQIVTNKYDYAIHLGDVYYAGRLQEFENNFVPFIDAIAKSSRVFTMNGNHEMFSYGRPYLDYIQQRRAKGQLQEGSYFCLRGNAEQIIGLDTDYFGYRRFNEPKLLAWLDAQLEYGRAHNLTNILLTGDEPYEYGKSGLTALLHDLADLVLRRQLVDLWFWGNTHYCALFDRAPFLPFYASCIGHGGFPYARVSAGKTMPAPVRFLETKPRFPEWTHLRQDRGNNGFCELTLRSGTGPRLRYIDWMSHDRCIVEFDRAAGGRLTMRPPNVL